MFLITIPKKPEAQLSAPGQPYKPTNPIIMISMVATNAALMTVMLALVLPFLPASLPVPSLNNSNSNSDSLPTA